MPTKRGRCLAIDAPSSVWRNGKLAVDFEPATGADLIGAPDCLREDAFLTDSPQTIQPSSDGEQAPLRVLQVCMSRSWGGLEMYPAKLARALLARGCEVHALVLSDSRVNESFDQANVPALAFASEVRAILSLREIVRYVRKHKITVVHAHKSGDMRLAALLLTLAPELKLFFTDHIGVGKPKKSLYHRWAYSKVTRVFSISKFTHARNLKAFAVQADHITQLYNGVEFDDYVSLLDKDARIAVRESLGVPKEGVLIAVPGRLTPGKGQMLWLRALARLSNTELTDRWHGVLIGDASAEDAAPGGFRDQLHRTVHELGLSERVTFAGFRQDMAQCLQACDIAAIPSFSEAFGLSVVEAMAAGCAVVGADAGAVPEIIATDTGLLAGATDDQDWAACFARLIDDPRLRMQLGRNARDRALSTFGMDHHAEKLTAYYRQAKLRD